MSIAVQDAAVAVEMARMDTEFRQKLFMRKVRFSKESCVAKWPRRGGKTHTLLKLVKPIFKRQKKKVQMLRGSLIGRRPKLIRKDTRVVIVDDASQALVNYIKQNRPDVRVVGLYSMDFDRGGEAVQKHAEKNVLFEK